MINTELLNVYLTFSMENPSKSQKDRNPNQPETSEQGEPTDRILNLSLDRINQLRTIAAAIYHSNLFRDRDEDGSNQWQQLWEELCRLERNELGPELRKKFISEGKKAQRLPLGRNNLFQRMRRNLLGFVQYGPRGSAKARRKLQEMDERLFKQQAAANKERIEEIRNIQLTTNLRTRHLDVSEDRRREHAQDPTGITIGDVWDNLNIAELNQFRIEDFANPKPILHYLMGAYEAKQNDSARIKFRRIPDYQLRARMESTNPFL